MAGAVEIGVTAARGARTTRGEEGRGPPPNGEPQSDGTPNRQRSPRGVGGRARPAIAGNDEVVRRLVAAEIGTVDVVGIDAGADPGDWPRAEIEVTRHMLQSFDEVIQDEQLRWWTSWEEAFQLATEHLSSETGHALERAMTSKPEAVSDEIRRALEGEHGLRMETEDGLVPLTVPAAGDEAWPEARYLTETARRAMETRPAMMDLLPHQLREQWKVQESRNRPKEILERIAKSVDWEDRYTVRRAFLAVCPHERDEVVVGGEPSLSAHYNVRDGNVTLRLESPAWERHGLTPPEGRVSAPTALILAGQTKQQLEHEQLQNAVDRLVWSDDTEEIDQVAATLAADPHGLLKPTPADDGAGPGGRHRNRIDFGRAKDRDTVQLYEQRLEEE